MPSYTYLIQDAPGVFHMHHHIVPEVRAMFAAMYSRMPEGGIVARYAQVLQGLIDNGAADIAAAEERLTRYPLPPSVQAFFDTNVKNYGHSSIMELAGNPPVFVEGVSLFTALRTFEGEPQGQETSTRAVRRADWPLAREAYNGAKPDPTLADLHARWFAVFEHEVEAWKLRLSSKKERDLLGIADKEPFRPALDRARWALPCTIATGFSHASNLRDRARVIRDGLAAATAERDPATIAVWEGMRVGTRNALPGMADMGLSEAVYTGHSVPDSFGVNVSHDVRRTTDDWKDTLVRITAKATGYPGRGFRAFGQKAYLDASYNHAFRVNSTIYCSFAAYRDWHRHRTAAPWRLTLPLFDDNLVAVHPFYEPLSDEGKAALPQLLQDSTNAFNYFSDKSQVTKAMMALPMGVCVIAESSMGLRHAVYTFELRRDAVGANFEYKAQATEAMIQLAERLPKEVSRRCGIIPANKF